MKLASLKYGRDGKLLVVSTDLSRAVLVEDIALTLQAALDDWAVVEPKLRKISENLNAGTCDSFVFEAEKCASPLPRAYQWIDGSAYVNHVELVRKARGADMPETFWTDPLMYQGGSDSFLGPMDDIAMQDEAWGIDFEAEVAVVTDDTPMGVSVKNAAGHIKLLMLVNDVSLRNLIPGELAKGFGFFQSKPSSAFSPVAVTPDELGEAWDGKKLSLPMLVNYNGEDYGHPDTGTDMVFDFPTLIAHSAKSRPLATGAIIGSGTISNNDRSKGSCCLAEKRMIEKIETGEMTTPFMKYGDTVRIDMQNSHGDSIFGTIEQKVIAYTPENIMSDSERQKMSCCS